MLLVAIPKSASTAFMETISRAHNLKCDMHFRWNGDKAKEFPKFGLQHAWDFELNDEAVQYFFNNEIICKVHVLPTINNLALLKGRKKVVLLRKPEGIVGAYKRGDDTGVYPQKTDAFSGCSSEEDWLVRAKYIGIYDDLKRFCDKWIEVVDEKLVIHFEDLVQDPAREIARVEDYYGLPRSNVKELLKRKYTRLGEQSLKFHKKTVQAWKESESGL